MTRALAQLGALLLVAASAMAVAGGASAVVEAESRAASSAARVQTLAVIPGGVRRFAHDTRHLAWLTGDVGWGRRCTLRVSFHDLRSGARTGVSGCRGRDNGDGLRELVVAAGRAYWTTRSALSLAAGLPALAGSAPAGNGRIVVVAPHGAGEARILSLEDEVTSVVDEGRALSWSPDGTRLAYLAPRPSGGFPWIRIRGTDGTVVQLEVPPRAEQPVWSPDGTQIAFVAERRNVYVAAADGSELRIVARDAIDGAPPPSWSADGHLIAYTSGEPARHETWRSIKVAVADVAGAGSRALTGEVRGGFPAPQFAPAGRELAFLRIAGEGAGYTLHLADVESGRVRQVSETALATRPPRWSPDGTRLLVTSAPLEQTAFVGDFFSDLYAVSRTGTVRRLTSRFLRYRLSEWSGVSSFGARWSPDGTKILFVREERGNHELLVMNADGTCETPLFRGGIHPTEGSFDWQPLPGAAPAEPLSCVDLGVEAALRRGTAALASERTFLVQVTNDGTEAARDVRLHGRLDRRLAVVAASSRGACATRSGTITCRLGTVAPRASVGVALRLRGAGAAAATLRVASAPRVDAHIANDSTVVDTRVLLCRPDAPAAAGPLTGTRGRDVLCGGTGRDRILGLAGDDEIHAGPGNDVAVLGPGRDRVFAGPGDDVVHAADGQRDVIYCGAGRDRVVADRIDYVWGDCERVERR